MTRSKTRVLLIVGLLVVMTAGWYARGAYDRFIELGEIKGGYIYLYECIESVNVFFEDKGTLPVSIQEALAHAWGNSKHDVSWASKIGLRYYPLASQDGTYCYCLVADFGRVPGRATAVAIVSFARNKAGKWTRQVQIHAGGEDSTRKYE